LKEIGMTKARRQGFYTRGKSNRSSKRLYMTGSPVEKLINLIEREAKHNPHASALQRKRDEDARAFRLSENQTKISEKELS